MSLRTLHESSTFDEPSETNDFRSDSTVAPLATSAAFDTRTDATLQVMPFGKGYITTGIWADGGRVVYARDVPGGYSVFVSDIATGATRVIDTAPVRAANPRISGNQVTWDDTRNDHPDSQPFHESQKYAGQCRPSQQVGQGKPPSG